MTQAEIAPKDRLIVALDVPSPAVAEAMIDRLGDSVTFYKIGYQLAYAGGLPLIGKLADKGKKVFADLKMHDIGNTVKSGVESVAKLGATFVTVHAYPQTMKGALEGRGSARPEDPRRHRADLLQRGRSARGGLPARGRRNGRGACAAGQGDRYRRHRVLAGGSRKPAQDRRPPDDTWSHRESGPRAPQPATRSAS